MIQTVMTETVTLNIDGRDIQARKGATLLDVARENGIEIPTLCHHEAVSAYGGCRLCVVEVVRGNRSRLVTSCLYPVDEGLVVKTDSKMVYNTRKGVLELLLSRCPTVELLQEMAAAYGITEPPFEADNRAEECILCGLCVRACSEIVGVHAISLTDRGIKRKVATPFEDPSETCIGCGSCVYICPTNAIKMEDKGDVRIIHNWKVEFKMKPCKVCGGFYAPDRQLEYFQKKLNLPEGFLDTCPSCR